MCRLPHSGADGTFDYALTPVASEAERGCGLWLGKPELRERGYIWRTEPVGLTVLINGPPTSILRSLGPVNFHGVSLPRSGEGGEQIQLSDHRSCQSRLACCDDLEFRKWNTAASRRTRPVLITPLDSSQLNLNRHVLLLPLR